MIGRDEATFLNERVVTGVFFSSQFLMPSEKQQRNVQSVCTHMSPGDTNNCTVESRDPPQKMIATQIFKNFRKRKFDNVFKNPLYSLLIRTTSRRNLIFYFFLKIWTMILPLALPIKPTL